MKDMTDPLLWAACATAGGYAASYAASKKNFAKMNLPAGASADNPGFEHVSLSNAGLAAMCGIATKADKDTKRKLLGTAGGILVAHGVLTAVNALHRKTEHRVNGTVAGAVMCTLGSASIARAVIKDD